MISDSVTGKFIKEKSFNEDYFEIIDSEDKAYWLGFIAADGCVYHRVIKKRNGLRHNYSLIMSTAELDLEHLTKFCSSIKANFIPKLMNKRVSNPCYQLTFYSKKIFDDLNHKGIVPKKSLILKPPKHVPNKFIKHWIRGYFDGDGSIFLTSKSQRYRADILGTFKVLDFIRDNVGNIGTDIRCQGKIFSYRISKQIELKQLRNFMYNDSTIWLERKRIKFFNMN
jgi:hypothetical protein